jgi:hypothetical protein
MNQISKSLILFVSMACATSCEKTSPLSTRSLDGTWAEVGVGCENIGAQPDAVAIISGADASRGSGDDVENYKISSQSSFMQPEKFVFTLQGNMARVYYRYAENKLTAFKARRYGTELKISKDKEPDLFGYFSLVKCSNSVPVAALGLRGAK